MAETFRNRIISYGVKPADQFLPNDKNARLHPAFQRDVMQAALTQVGFVAPVIETRDGILLDGHERIWQALKNNADVPFVVVDMDSTDPDADFVLSTFDPITNLANYDAQRLDALLQEINTDSPALQAMLSQLAAEVGLIAPDDPYAEWKGMPEFETDPLAFRSIQVHFKSQADIDAFAELIEQSITEKTRSIWYPYQEKQDRKTLSYQSDEP